MTSNYHWIMTLRWPVPDGYGIGTGDGLIEGGAGTRMEYFRHIRKIAAEAIGAPETARVLYFSLEREEQM